jgi:hypothetical protein
MHNKAMIADNEGAILGGRNIGDAGSVSAMLRAPLARPTAVKRRPYARPEKRYNHDGTALSTTVVQRATALLKRDRL